MIIFGIYFLRICFSHFTCIKKCMIFCINIPIKVCKWSFFMFVSVYLWNLLRILEIHYFFIWQIYLFIVNFHVDRRMETMQWSSILMFGIPFRLQITVYIWCVTINCGVNTNQFMKGLASKFKVFEEYFCTRYHAWKFD